MKNRIKVLLLCILSMAIMLTGCTTHKMISLTFNVATGDAVKVEYSGEGSLTPSDSMFTVTDGDFTMSGIFQYPEDFQEICNQLNGDFAEYVDIIQQTDDLIIYTYNESMEGQEYTAAIKLVSDKTSVAAYADTDSDIMLQHYENLTLSVE